MNSQKDLPKIVTNMNLPVVKINGRYLLYWDEGTSGGDTEMEQSCVHGIKLRWMCDECKEWSEKRKERPPATPKAPPPSIVGKEFFVDVNGDKKKFVIMSLGLCVKNGENKEFALTVLPTNTDTSNQSCIGCDGFYACTHKPDKRGDCFVKSEQPNNPPKEFTDKATEFDYFMKRSAELRSLHGAINESFLKAYYPKKDMPLNQKIIIALSKVESVLKSAEKEKEEKE